MTSIGAMFAAGGRALWRHRRVLLGLYLCDLLISLLFVFVVAHALGGLFAHAPLFTRGVHGDDAAVLLSLQPHLAVVGALVWAGIAFLVAYALFSLWLTAGLLGVLAGPRGFGESAGRHFLAMLRLSGWSLAGHGAALIAMGVSIRLVGGTDFEGTRAAIVLGRPLLAATPGILLFVIVGCAVDYARADLVVGDHPRTTRAFGRGLRRTLTSPVPVLHYALYLLVWIGACVLYVLVTAGHAFAGAVGALVLFGVRQALVATRLGARMATYAGQVARTKGV